MHDQRSIFIHFFFRRVLCPCNVTAPLATSSAMILTLRACLFRMWTVPQEMLWRVAVIANHVLLRYIACLFVLWPLEPPSFDALRLLFQGPNAFWIFFVGVGLSQISSFFLFSTCHLWEILICFHSRHWTHRVRQSALYHSVVYRPIKASISTSLWIAS